MTEEFNLKEDFEKITSSKMSSRNILQKTAVDLSMAPKDDRNKGNNSNSNQTKQFKNRSGHSSFNKARYQSNSQNDFIPKFQNSYRNRNQRNGYVTNHNYASNGGRKKQIMRSQQDDLDMPVGEKLSNKKINLNHLLNFTFNPHEDDAPRYNSNSWKYGSRKKVNQQTKTFDKEKFLQANCQFVVKDGKCYDVHQMDPDTLVDWQNIEQINIWSEEHPICPICLDPPYAAKITRCGHIYCWSCMLHYLALDDRTWRKCPICHEAVHKKDLKSVIVKPEKSLKVGNKITMKLMYRFRGYTIPAVVSNKNDELPSLVSKKFGEYNFDEPRTWKILEASTKDVLERIVEREEQELLTRKALENDELESSFIDYALKECGEKKNTVLSSSNIVLTEEIGDAISFEAINDSIFDIAVLSEAIHEGERSADEDTVPSIASKISTEECSTSQQQHVYYFYQSSDDQHIYLHPLNVKCLVKEYGSLDKCPKEITANLMEIQRYTMDENLRKRHRYLSHLPLSCEFGVAEISLKPPVISQGILNHFKKAIDERASQRKTKLREEKRTLKRAQIEEQKKHGIYPQARVSLESNRQFPTMETSNGKNKRGSFSVLVGASRNEESNIEVSSSTSSSSMTTPLSCSLGSQDGWGGDISDGSFSFAQMVRSTSQPVQVRPVVKSRPEQSLVAPTIDENSEFYDPDYVPPPTYQSTFSDALSSALAKLDATSPEDNKPRGGRRSKKKKDKKKVLLFSTSSHIS